MTNDGRTTAIVVPNAPPHNKRCVFVLFIEQECNCILAVCGVRKLPFYPPGIECNELAKRAGRPQLTNTRRVAEISDMHRQCTK